MNRELQAPNQSEYFEEARTLGEVMSAYDELLHQAVVEHQTQFTDIVAAHDKAFSKELKQAGTVDTDDTMRSTATRVEQAVEPVVAKVDDIINAAAEVIPTMLDDNSLQLLNEAKRQAYKFGIDSHLVTEVVDRAPEKTRIALRAALDADVFAKVKKQVYYFGADSHLVDQALDGASASQARSAMLTSLDTTVFAKVKKQVYYFGADSRLVDQALDGASTPTIRAAMKAAIDGDVLSRAKDKANLFSPNSPFVQEVLDHASSKNVQAVFARQIGNQQSPDQQTDIAPPKTRAETFRSLALKSASAVALAAAAVTAIHYLAEASKGHSGPKYDAQTEAAIERIITPEMQKIANTALKLAASNPSGVGVTHPTNEITEIQSYPTDNTNSIDVVMRNFPGTQTPNPTDVLATDLQSNLNPGAHKGISAYNEVLYAAPNSVQYLSGTTLTGIYKADNDGWTAIANHDDAQNGVVDMIDSGAIDTAESADYAVDDNHKSVGPVGTAQSTIPFAETFRPIVERALSRGSK